MNRENFIKGLGVESSNMNKNWITNVLIESIDSNLSDGNPRGYRNLIIVMEELAELSQAIAKELRDKGDNINLLEELADVQLGIYYIQEIFGITDEHLHKAMNVKMKRLENVLQHNGKYK